MQKDKLDNNGEKRKQRIMQEKRETDNNSKKS